MAWIVVVREALELVAIGCFLLAVAVWWLYIELIRLEKLVKGEGK